MLLWASWFKPSHSQCGDLGFKSRLEYKKQRNLAGEKISENSALTSRKNREDQGAPTRKVKILVYNEFC